MTTIAPVMSSSDRILLLLDVITWQPRDGIPPLEINLPEFFAAALK